MMKLRRTLGGILFGVGCAFAFIAVLALFLPSVENDQLKLVLASFDMKSEHPVVNVMNQGMSYALHNGWQMLLFAGILMVVGLLLLLFSREPEPEPYRRPEPQPMPQWESAPAFEPESNPFASAALWENQFAPAKRQETRTENPFPVYGGPMLDKNRIEDTPAYAFAPDLYTRPAEEERKPAAPVHAPAAQPVSLFEKRGSAPAAMPAMEKPQIAAEPEAKPEVVYTPNEEPEEPVMLSSRIRSTMGRKREW